MAIFPYLAVVSVFGAVFLFTRVAHEQTSAWWHRRTRRYAQWVLSELETIFESVAIDRAQRWITIVTIGGLLTGIALGNSVASRIFWGLVLLIAGYFLPTGYVLWKKQRRLRQIDGQLVDAFRLMANSLKAGLSLQQAIELVVKEMKPPITDEFGGVVKQIHLGRLTDDALRHLMERVPLPDMRLAIDSVLILRETGGNLVETFEMVADTIVERKKVEGKISAMTAQGMSQGVLMCLMPIGMLLLFTAIDESYMRPMYETPLGWAVLTLIFVLDAMGLWLMFKLVKVDV